MQQITNYSQQWTRKYVYILRITSYLYKRVVQNCLLKKRHQWIIFQTPFRTRHLALIFALHQHPSILFYFYIIRKVPILPDNRHLNLLPPRSKPTRFTWQEAFVVTVIWSGECAAGLELKINGEKKKKKKNNAATSARLRPSSPSNCWETEQAPNGRDDGWTKRPQSYNWLEWIPNNKKIHTK